MLKVKKFMKINGKAYTKALRFFKGNNIKLILSYSQCFDGKKWHDNKMTPRNLGFFKSKESTFVARAVIIGKHKFSLLVAN